MAYFTFLTLTIEGANSYTTFFICLLVYRYSSVVGNGGGIQVDLTAPGAGRDQESQSCSGPSGSSPTPATPYQGNGRTMKFAKAAPAAWWGPVGAFFYPVPVSVLPPAPRPPLSFQLGYVPLWEEEDTPTRAPGSRVLLTERLLGQTLCPVPYQPWGEDVWLENWNLIAIVFDFVIFLLGRVKSPSRSLACVPTLPCHGCSPLTLQLQKC